MTYKLITPDVFETYKGHPFFGDKRDEVLLDEMRAYLDRTSMFAPNVMETKLPSTLLFYVNEDRKIGTKVVCVGQNDYDTLENLSSKDKFFVAYYSPARFAMRAKNEPELNPDEAYRFCEIETELDDSEFDFTPRNKAP